MTEIQVKRLKRPIKKSETFNVVVEGTYPDEWRTLHYKVTNIAGEIEPDAALINDGTYKYELYGKTEDFETVQRQNPEEVGGLELELDIFLGLSPGIVLPFMGGVPNRLDRPRAICTRDGRLFVDDGMVKDKQYLDALPTIVRNAKGIFESENIAKLYREVTGL